MKLHDLRPRRRARVSRGPASAAASPPARARPPAAAPRARRPAPAARSRPGSRAARRRSTCASPSCAASRTAFKIEYEVVNVGDIGALAEGGAFELEGGKKPAKAAPITVNQDILRAVGLVRTLNKPMKILGAGDLSVPLFVVADAFSASARAKIEAAGGSVNVLEVPTTSSPALGVDPRRQGDRRPRHPPRRPRPRPRARRSPPRPRRRARRPRPRRRRPRRPPSAKAAKATAAKATAAKAPEGIEGVGREGRRRARRRRRRRDAGRRHVGHGRASRQRRRAHRGRDRDAVRRRRLTRVRLPPQRLPRAGHPAADPLRPGPADRLPAAGLGADAGRRQGAAPAASSRATPSSACSTCSRAAACRTSRSWPSA